MKFKKIMLVTLLLLAVLTIGAVSASDSADTLAVDDGADDLAIEESSAEVLSEGPDFEDIAIGVNTENSFSRKIPDLENPVIEIQTLMDANGTIVVSSGDNVFFNKELKDFNPEHTWEDGDIKCYDIYNFDLEYFHDLSGGEIVKVSFLNGDENIVSRFNQINIEDDEFDLYDPFNVWFYENDDYWQLNPLYSDYNKAVISIAIWTEGLEGVFNVSCNGREYKYEFICEGEEGDAWAYRDFLLSSFDIDTPGLYPVTVKFGYDEESMDVIDKYTLNVTEFNYDVFRLVDEYLNNKISLYCPENNEGAEIFIFVKDEDEEEYPDEPTIHQTIDDNDGHWLSWDYSELASEGYKDYSYYLIVADESGAIYNRFDEPIEDTFRYVDWEPFETDEITMLICDGEIRDDDYRVLEIYIPEKSYVYNANIDITIGDNVLFSKELSTKDMDFDSDPRCRYYQYNVEWWELDWDDEYYGNLAIFNFTCPGTEVINKRFFWLYDYDDVYTILSVVKSIPANVLTDDVLLVISEIPDGVDDEFEVSLEFFYQCSLDKNNLDQDENGSYLIRCSDLGLWGNDNLWGYVIFFKDGEEDSSYYIRIHFNTNPSIEEGEFTLDDDGPIVYFEGNPSDLTEVFDEDFTIMVYNESEVLTNLPLNLNDMEQYAHEYEEEGEIIKEYYLTLEDLNITENGHYDISIKLTRGNEVIYYNATIDIVDFILWMNDGGDDFDINGIIAYIEVDEGTEGNVTLYVDDEKVLDAALDEFRYASRHGAKGYWVFLNDFNITTDGVYELKLNVSLADGHSRVASGDNFNISIFENEVNFTDMVYSFGYFFTAQWGTPVPADTHAVLYLNGEEIGSNPVGFGFDFFEFSPGTPFADDLWMLMPGEYDAEFKLVSGGSEFASWSGTFNVLTENGDVDITVPPYILADENLIVTFYASRPAEELQDRYALEIFLDPTVDDWGWIEDDPVFSLWGHDLDDYWDEVNEIDLGELSKGSHKVYILYRYDDDNDAINYDFFAANLKVVFDEDSSVVVEPSYNITYGEVSDITATDLYGASGITAALYYGTVKVKDLQVDYLTITIDTNDLQADNYTLSVTTIPYAGYVETTVYSTIIVSKADSHLTIPEYVNGTYDQDIVIPITNAVGVSNITAELFYEGVPIVDALIVTNDNITIILPINVGTYTLKVNATGDVNHYDSSYASVVNVTPAQSVIVIDDEYSVGLGENITIEPLMYGAEGFAAALYDNNGTMVRDLVGETDVTIDTTGLEAGNYTLKVTTIVDPNHIIDTDEAILEIYKGYAYLEVAADSIFVGQSAIVNVSTVPGATGNVSITVNNKTETVILNNGKASATFADLPEGTYLVQAIYNGDSQYYKDVAFAYFNVTAKYESHVSIDVQDSFVGEAFNITVTVTGDGTTTFDGKVRIVSEYISLLEINVTSGKAVFEITNNVHPGSFVVTATYFDDTARADSEASATFNVLTKESVFVDDIKRGWNSPYDFNATFTDGLAPLKNVTVQFVANGITYNATTDDAGVAYLKAELAEGTYNVTAVNLVTGQNATATTTIVPRLIVVSGDLTADYLENPPYIVQAIGDDGEHVGANVTVRIVFAGFYYDLPTNETGHVVRSIALAPGSYAVRGEYAGYKTEQTPFQVLQILQASSGTLKKKTAKTYTLKATLKHTNGKAIAGATVRLNFNGNNYIVTTNSKGVASYTLKSSQISKLKAGKTYVLKALYINDWTKGKWQGKIKVVNK